MHLGCTLEHVSHAKSKLQLAKLVERGRVLLVDSVKAVGPPSPDVCDAHDGNELFSAVFVTLI